jgi:hypothetical protein
VVERRTVNPLVGGSNPSRGANNQAVTRRAKPRSSHSRTPLLRDFCPLAGRAKAPIEDHLLRCRRHEYPRYRCGGAVRRAGNTLGTGAPPATGRNLGTDLAPRCAGVTAARSLLCGANMPWNRVRCIRGAGTGAAKRAIRSSGSSTMCVGSRGALRFQSYEHPAAITHENDLHALGFEYYATLTKVR